MSSRRLFVAVMLVATGVAASAQDAAQQPVFRSGTDLVRLDVRVVDDSGRAIPDLRPDEIEILEGGTSRPVLLFQHIEEPQGTYVQAAARAISAEVTSNQGSPRGHLYILIFDQQHITAGNEQRARRAAEAFINRRVRPSDRVAIYGIPGPGPQLAFTADRPRAARELERVRGGFERFVSTPLGAMSLHEAYEIARNNDRMLIDVQRRFGSGATGDIRGSGSGAAAAGRTGSGEDPSVVRRLIIENARTVVAQADAESRQFLQRTTELIRQYRAIEGRKAVVLFSEGFSQQNVTRELDQVAAAAAQSYAVFYSMDLNRRQSDLSDPNLPTTDAGTEIQERIEPLGNLAVETDGTLINAAADYLDTALDRIADLAQDYYIVGFAPAKEALDARDTYRRITVRVRRPGARVSTRTGYAVGPDPTPADRRHAIDTAIAAPFAQQGVRVEYSTYVLRSPDGRGQSVFLTLAADLPVRDNNNTQADVVFVVRDTRDGRVAAGGTDTIPLPTANNHGAATGTGRYRVRFELPPGTYMMRAVVREPGGLIGSADRRLDVRPLAGPDVSVSDLVFGSSTGSLPVRARAHTEDGVSGLVEAYARAASQLDDMTVDLDLIAVGAETPAASVRAELSPVELTGTGVKRRAEFRLPLASLPPGEYIARATVRADGESAAQTTRQLEVVAGKAAVTASGPVVETVSARDILDGDLVRRYAETLKTTSTPATELAVRGLDLFRREQYAEAARVLDQALDLDRSSAPAAFVAGWANAFAGDQRKALSAWRAAAAIDPMMVSAYLALADGYLKLNEPALAIQSLRAGLKALPDSAELRDRLLAIEKSIQSSGAAISRQSQEAQS